MKEVFHYAPADHPAEKPDDPTEVIDPEFSVTGGEYADPNPNIVGWIFKSRRFKDPADNIEATVIHAFEVAGLVKTEKEVQAMVEPLEESRLLPTDEEDGELPTYADEEQEISAFMDRREAQLFLELQEGNTTRNQVLQKVMKKTGERMFYSSTQIARLRADARTFVRELEGVPPVAEIITVMIGLRTPKDENLKITVPAPESTDEMALDVYWMLLREEMEAKRSDIRHKQPA